MISSEDVVAVARQTVVSLDQLSLQVVQTQFRMQLVMGWQIPQGAKVLEIGCGQGDMTAALANAVGPMGHVTAVDIASPDYGAPTTVGESAAHLKSTSLGERIDFHFEYNVLDPIRSFPTDRFDYIVLSHCSWYFEDLEQLQQVLLRIRPWTRHLCFSEWDLEPQTMDQLPHLLAILIQGQVEAYKVGSAGNVRTPASRTRFKQLLQDTGWKVSQEATVDSTQLQDAGWEIEICLSEAIADAEVLNLPLKHLELLASQVDLLLAVARKGHSRSLASYSIVAEKSQ